MSTILHHIAKYAVVSFTVSFLGCCGVELASHAFGWAL